MSVQPTEYPSTYVSDLKLQLSILKVRRNVMMEQYRIGDVHNDLSTSNYKSIAQDVKDEWRALGRLILQTNVMIHEYESQFECDDKYQRHESYGSIVLTNPTGNANLFGSGVKHQHYVSLSIHTAELKRDLNHDWIHPKREIININMSHEQWGRFISSGGRGEGTPCTISQIGLRQIDKPPFYSKPAQFKQEMMNKLEEISTRVSQMSDIVQPLMQSGAVTKATKDQIISKVHNLQQDITRNMPYITDCYVEAMEKITSQAKTEIESYVNHVAHTVGMDVIKQNTSSVLQIEEDKTEE